MMESLELGFQFLCLGDIGYDLSIEIDRLPEKGKEIHTDRFSVHFGGAAANVAVAAARLGAKTSFLGNFSRDPFGKPLIDDLEKEGIEIFPSFSEHNSPMFIVFIHPGGEKSFVAFRGASEQLSNFSLFEQIQEKNSVIHIAGYCFLSDPLRSYALRAMKVARSSEDTLVSLDPNGAGVDWMKDKITEAVPLADVFLPNRDEALALSGKKNLEDAIEVFLDTASIVIVKDGRNGAVLSSPKYNVPITRIPTISASAVDTTGAGDIFDGAFFACYRDGKGLSLIEATRLACFAASLSTESIGARSGPSLKELQENQHRLENYPDIRDSLSYFQELKDLSAK